MSLLATIQSMLPRPERRSESEIEDDLDDEFAFHLEMKTRDLVNEGHSPNAARDMARQIFGDLERIKRKCKRIALEERIMLQRVNFIMMIIVLVMVVGVGLQVYITQRYNTLALQAITSDLARMKFDSRAAERGAGLGVAYIDGDIARPGVYQIPQVGQLTVKRLIAAAGDVTGHADARVTVSEIATDGHSIIKFNAERIRGVGQADFVLSGDDHVHVEHAADAANSTVASSGSVLVQGDVEKPTWYPITLDPPTSISDVLKRAGVTDQQWVKYLPANQSAARFDFFPMHDVLRSTYGKVVARPGDELYIQNQVSPSERRNHYLTIWSVCYHGAKWQTANGDDPASNWELSLDRIGSSEALGVLRRMDDAVTLHVRLDEVLVFSTTEFPSRRAPVVNLAASMWNAEWDVESDAIVLQLKHAWPAQNFRPQAPTPVRDPLWPDELRFPLVSDNWCGSMPQH